MAEYNTEKFIRELKELPGTKIISYKASLSPKKKIK